MLDLLSEIVTFTVSSRRTSSSREGRKSGTTLSLPKGSSVYFVFPLINSFSSSPKSGANDSNNADSVCESDGQNPVGDFPETVIPLFRITMGNVFGDDTMCIEESILRLGK